jgi:hypothetical protein
MRPPAKVRERIVSVCARLQRFTLYEITRNLTKTRPVVRQQPVRLSAVSRRPVGGRCKRKRVARALQGAISEQSPPTIKPMPQVARLSCALCSCQRQSRLSKSVGDGSEWRLCGGYKIVPIKMNPCQSVIGAELPVLPYCPAGLLWPQLSLARDRPRGPCLALGGDKDIRQPA